jgi:NAD(P)H-hydrate repair Nnr-like enzyme with NAD(P)H-hydrate dehydratase domain
MSSKHDVWVVTHGSRWAVRIAGSGSLSSIHQTQAEAIEAGRPLAQRFGSDLVIQGRDSKIRDRDSYGNDPFPPRDRKH